MPTHEHLTFSSFSSHSGERPPTQQHTHTPPTQTLSLTQTLTHIHTLAAKLCFESNCLWICAALCCRLHPGNADLFIFYYQHFLVENGGVWPRVCVNRPLSHVYSRSSISVQVNSLHGRRCANFLSLSVSLSLCMCVYAKLIKRIQVADEHQHKLRPPAHT